MLSRPMKVQNQTFLQKRYQYFHEVDKSRNLHSDLATKVEIDVWSRIVDQVASLVPEWDVRLATEGPN